MDGMGLVYQEEEKLIDTGLNIIMPGLSGHIPSFLFFLLFKMHFITVYRSGCQNCWYKQESRCINNAMAGLDVAVLRCLSNLNMGGE